MAVTSIEKLKKLSQGQEVELQGWDEEPFVCVLKRPSLLGLVENGDIPNPLLHAAYILFNGSNNPKDQVNLKEMNDLYRIIAKAAMVNPTYDQVVEAGLELTDMQLLEIFSFTQIGLQGLISFRTKQEDTKNTKRK